MFKQTYTFDHRKKESDRVRKKFPLKTPIVIELKDIDTKNTELITLIDRLKENIY